MSSTLLPFYYTVPSVKFNQSSYTFEEKVGSAQPFLVFTVPAAHIITIKVLSQDISATGMYIHILRVV